MITASPSVKYCQQYPVFVPRNVILNYDTSLQFIYRSYDGVDCWNRSWAVCCVINATMPILNKCCCCSLRTGAIVSGVLGVVRTEECRLYWKQPSYLYQTIEQPSNMQVLHLATLKLVLNTTYCMEHNSKYPHTNQTTSRAEVFKF